MHDWLKLRRVPLRKVAPPESGLHFDIVVSPYEVPEAVRGETQRDGSLRIEFRYIDGPEPSGDRVALGPGVVLVEGRYSHRILALEIDSNLVPAHAVSVAIRKEIDSAWDHMAAHKPATYGPALETAKEALLTRESDLMSQLSGVSGSR